MRRRWVLLILGAMVGSLTYWGCFLTPPGPRSLRVFDADRVADLEIDMWQAYYAKERVRLFRGLVTMLHEQNRYPWSKSVRAGFYLARAAARFAELRSDYESVLPAELAWWVARRIGGQNSPEQVGELIAEENAMLYGVPRDRVLASSVLRARAGRLRDDGGAHADWTTVSSLLHQSYRALHSAVQ